ncbi:MAG: indolepyruvate ferredoxin oxidoreductase [Phycisphaerales bacterium]|nr:indolepyruvate ferredoxin oxidoreductase [Phycisphaerales bacterium]
MIELLMGDEAVALGAIHSGIGGAFSYPGTPATEIFEFVQRHAGRGRTLVARWSANEKVAYEEAMGMSFVGKRALVSMKHVGLNVAADPFMSSSLTGANGGLVLAVADDPGMHSSQNEQDSRFYGQFAQIPVFEPGDQQEAYDMTREAFQASERFGLPVMLRLVTRLAHSRADITTRPAVEPLPRGRVTDWREWTLLPVNARKRYGRLLEMQPPMQDYATLSGFNRLTLRGPKGVIVTGLANNYFREASAGADGYSVLKLGVYPVPAGMVRRLVDHCTDVLVIEEGYPLVERQLVGLMGVPGKSIRGKLDGTLPGQGELTTDIIRAVLEGRVACPTPVVMDIPGRPPQLCQGCPHCDTYGAVVEAAQGAGAGQPYFFSDIGCYSLAALPPYNAIDSCVDMGASISMAIGAAKAGAHPVVATIGDSTFVHSGMTGLIGAVHDDLNMTVVILDNALVAMTGGQEVFATGPDLIRIIRGLGVRPEHLVELDPVPTAHPRNVELIRREIGHRGLSVVVTQRACIHAKRKGQRDEGTEGRGQGGTKGETAVIAAGG